MSKDRDPADYVIGDDATIEDVNLDDLNLTYQGEPLTEARALDLDEQIARELAARDANDREADAAERWLDQLDLDDPNVRVYNLEGLTAAVRQLREAVAAALADGVPARVIRFSTNLLDDELSLLLRSGDALPVEQVREDLGLEDDRRDA